MESIFHKITKQIEKHSNVIIMAHKNIDLDAFGSALCLYKIIQSMDIPCGIFMSNEELDATINIAKKKLEERSIIVDYYDRSNYKHYVTPETLLVIVDTHKKTMVEYPEILSEVNDVVVIDHHIKSTEAVENAKVFYINSSLSSTNEWMVNYLKYLNKTVSPLVATIMLAGIEIDTNGFNLKTTDKTYEAAAFLTKLGADHIQKQELLKENKESYLKRQDFVKTSFMINANMAMCLLDNEIHKKADLAMIAEELLKFENVEASFAIGKLSEEVIGVSARSVGNINVEKIMNAIGGGGHKTDAAAQLEHITIQEVKTKIEEIVNA